MTLGTTSGRPESWSEVITEPTRTGLEHTPTHLLKNKQLTQAIYCLSRRTTQNSENIEKHTPLNYTGSYKQNKVSFYIYISRGNDR